MKNLPSLGLLLVMTLLSPAMAMAGALTADDFADMCKGNIASLQQSIDADSRMPEPAKRVFKIFNNPVACECVRQDLLSSGLKTFPEGDASMSRYIKSNASCMAQEINKEFPQQCQGLYRDLLPYMGYRSDDEKKLDDMCSCATKVVSKIITAETLYSASTSNYWYYVAVSADKKSGTHTADLIRRKPNPIDSGGEEIRSCADSTFGGSVQ